MSQGLTKRASHTVQHLEFHGMAMDVIGMCRLAYTSTSCFIRDIIARSLAGLLPSARNTSQCLRTKYLVRRNMYVKLSGAAEQGDYIRCIRIQWSEERPHHTVYSVDSNGPSHCCQTSLMTLLGKRRPLQSHYIHGHTLLIPKLKMYHAFSTARLR